MLTVRVDLVGNIDIPTIAILPPRLGFMDVHHVHHVHPLPMMAKSRAMAAMAISHKKSCWSSLGVFDVEACRSQIPKRTSHHGWNLWMWMNTPAIPCHNRIHILYKCLKRDRHALPGDPMESLSAESDSEVCRWTSDGETTCSSQELVGM